MILNKFHLNEHDRLFLMKYCLLHEDEILNTGVPDYHGTPAHMTTSRHNYYNLLFNEDVRNIFSKYLINLNLCNFYVKMWTNIYRRGDYIKPHNHVGAVKINVGNGLIYSDNPTGIFLSSSIDENTATYKNLSDGEFIVIDSTTYHSVPAYEGDLRITITFDIIENDEMNSHPCKESLISKYVLIQNSLKT